MFVPQPSPPLSPPCSLSSSLVAARGLFCAGVCRAPPARWREQLPQRRRRCIRALASVGGRQRRVSASRPDERRRPAGARIGRANGHGSGNNSNNDKDNGDDDDNDSNSRGNGGQAWRKTKSKGKTKKETTTTTTGHADAVSKHALSRRQHPSNRPRETLWTNAAARIVLDAREAGATERSPPQWRTGHSIALSRAAPNGASVAAAAAAASADAEAPDDIAPSQFPALVLNADFQPLSYLPLSLWPWQDVIKAVVLGRVRVVAEYAVAVRAPSCKIQLPSVVSLKEYRRFADKTPAFTRFNVFLRDKFRCQYCGTRQPVNTLTFDHIVPRCRGGVTGWRNVVTACAPCNHRKGRRLLREMPNMRLQRAPVQPRHIDLQRQARQYAPQYLHETWIDFLYWDTPMLNEEEEEEDVEAEAATEKAAAIRAR